MNCVYHLHIYIVCGICIQWECSITIPAELTVPPPRKANSHCNIQHTLYHAINTIHTFIREHVCLYIYCIYGSFSMRAVSLSNLHFSILKRCCEEHISSSYIFTKSIHGKTKK